MLAEDCQQLNQRKSNCRQWCKPGQNTCGRGQDHAQRTENFGNPQEAEKSIRALLWLGKLRLCLFNMDEYFGGPDKLKGSYNDLFA